MATNRSASDLDLDGLRFAMVSSTASEVDPSSPTIFDYHERDGMIWGEYEGDTVRIGRFVGTSTAFGFGKGRQFSQTRWCFS